MIFARNYPPSNRSPECSSTVPPYHLSVTYTPDTRSMLQDKIKEEVITWKVPPVSDYDTLAAEWTEKKWRMLPKPGGAVMKPEDWYCLWG